jgi:hypothetical protein
MNLAPIAGAETTIGQLEVASKPRITPAGKAHAAQALAPRAGRIESGATFIGCEHFERPATPPPGLRRGYEATSKIQSQLCLKVKQKAVGKWLAF